jgi:hypothetical protein
MCRWLAYSGSPIPLEAVLLKRDRSLIDQSLHSRLGATTTNGDGFGVGWYDGAEAPGSTAARTRLGTTATCASSPPDPLPALPRAHTRLDGDGDPGDEHAPVPARPLALDAQRADP